MSLQPGTKLAHYEVVEPIGRGGMGEVYRAKDTKLGRDVAIKVIPDEFADNEERLARFQREATVLASLNHPNIGGIYGLEEAGATRFLVLELVPGDTLDERLRSGALPPEEALELAGQIAGALAAAHDSGVIHRDLKPANIKITPEGQVKVLDFGLAKALADGPSDGKLSDSPTLSAHATKVGVILGTAAYMSPEQARGKPVDKRTDIFSFGVVLYEMFTGRQLFKGEDAADTMASVIRSDPDFRALPDELSERVREILARCLEKDPNKRRRDMGDIGAELEAARGRAGAETRERRGRQPASWLGAASVVGASLVAGIAGWHLKPDAPRPVQRFEMALPEGAMFGGSSRPIIAISPAGTHLAIAANSQIYLRALDQVDAGPIRGTENGFAPFFSPDGKWIGFWADGYLKKVPLAGGSPVNLCETEPPFGASWAEDGTIVYARGGLWEVSENGGVPKQLAAGATTVHYWGPRKLPGGDALLVTVNDIAGGTWDGAAIVAEKLDTGERKTLIEGGTDARYVPTGHLLYAVASTVFAVPFDLGKLEVTGGPVPVIDGVSRSRASGVAQFGFSNNGTFAFASEGGDAEQALFWLDRSGRASRITDNTAAFGEPRVSPDGKRLAVTVAVADGSDVWVVDLARDTLTQLTNDGASSSPDWSPDGEWLVVTSADDLFRVRTDFRGTPEPLLEREGRQVHTRWRPDGKGLVFQEGGGGEADLWTLDLGADADADAEPRLFLRTPVNEAQPDLSPDGRFIVYHSTVSGGTSQIFVQPFDGPGRRLQISRGGGNSPRWSPAGDEIFYLNVERQAIMAVDIRTEPELDAGAPRLLFEWPVGRGFDRDYDVAPDGQRFVVVGPTNTGAESRPRIQLVLNWFEELERIAPND